MSWWWSKRCHLEELNISQSSFPPYSLHLQVNLFLNMIHFCITRYNSEIISGISSGMLGFNALSLITRVKDPTSSHWSQFAELSPAAWSKSLWATSAFPKVCKAAQPCGVGPRMEAVWTGKRWGRQRCRKIPVWHFYLSSRSQPKWRTSWLQGLLLKLDVSIQVPDQLVFKLWFLSIWERFNWPNVCGPPS